MGYYDGGVRAVVDGIPCRVASKPGPGRKSLGWSVYRPERRTAQEALNDTINDHAAYLKAMGRL